MPRMMIQGYQGMLGAEPRDPRLPIGPKLPSPDGHECAPADACESDDDVEDLRAVEDGEMQSALNPHRGNFGLYAHTVIAKAKSR